MTRKLIAIDVTNHDTVAALKMLTAMAEKGDIIGMVFAARLNHGRKAPHHRFTGATGRYAENPVEAAGVAGILHLQMAQHAAES